MSKRTGSNRAHGKSTREQAFPVDKMGHMLEILVRISPRELRDKRGQADTILKLSSAGCGPSEIADLLGTTANTVNVTLSNAKKKRRKN